jgi:hypothetical protein
MIFANLGLVWEHMFVWIISHETTNIVLSEQINTGHQSNE